MMKTQETNTYNTVKETPLAELLNNFSIDAIIAFDTERMIIAWNKAAEAIYGRSKEEAVGGSLYALIPGLSEDAASVNAVNQALKGFNSFVAASKWHEHRRHTENHYIPIKNSEGYVIAAMNIVHDVSHRIKAEQQLQQLNEELEKRYKQLQVTSDELASFTYITSSKIKEPIRHIYTGVEYLIKTEAARLSDSGKASFRRIQSSLNRMDLLLDDILKISQISVLEKPDAMVDLNEVMQEVATEIKQKAETTVDINIGDLCTIHGHKEYLHILFHNLLDNAVKFNKSATPEIKISCEKVIVNEAGEVATPVNEFYKLTIADNGIGFASEDAARIFTMFEKLHDKRYKGSGIGLTIARKIMNAHDGFITAEGQEGKGAIFHCFFPIPSD